MKLLDLFKKKKDIIPNNRENQLPFNMKFTTTSNGCMQIDFQDLNANFKKFYDTTRLITNGQPINIQGHSVYECMVSWYGSNDCIMLNEKGEEYGRKTDYENILAELDLNLLQTNPTYAEAVMKSLLDEQRVKRLLEMGLEEYPERPCGEYIGGIGVEEGKYKKVFFANVGEASHNSTKMINKRREHKIAMENARQMSIRKKQQEIERLQDEINNLNDGETRY